jgi:hypothetical protein
MLIQKEKKGKKKETHPHRESNVAPCQNRGPVCPDRTFLGGVAQRCGRRKGASAREAKGPAAGWRLGGQGGTSSLQNSFFDFYWVASSELAQVLDRPVGSRPKSRYRSGGFSPLFFCSDSLPCPHRRGRKEEEKLRRVNKKKKGFF